MDEKTLVETEGDLASEAGSMEDYEIPEASIDLAELETWQQKVEEQLQRACVIPVCDHLKTAVMDNLTRLQTIEARLELKEYS